MDLLEGLRTRRSMRDYTSEPVSDADLKTMLEIGMLAPSARNEQPWRFVAVRDAGVREILAKTTPYTHMAAKSPLVIVVCGDMSADKANGMWVQDCAAATENILLAARGLNLGCVWCGVHPVAEREAHVRDAVGLPEGIVPFCLICIGHPVKEFKAEDRYRQEYVHMDRW